MQAKAPTSAGDQARRRYEELVARFAHPADVDLKGQGFGRSALKVGGKMFATLSSRGRLVVKLPQERVQSLVTSGDGRPFEPRPGRVMKEWLELSPESRQDWVKLADEARSFVAGSNSIARQPHSPTGGRARGRLPKSVAVLQASVTE